MVFWHSYPKTYDPRIWNGLERARKGKGGSKKEVGKQGRKEKVGAKEQRGEK